MRVVSNLPVWCGSDPARKPSELQSRPPLAVVNVYPTQPLQFAVVSFTRGQRLILQALWVQKSKIRPLAIQFDRFNSFRWLAMYGVSRPRHGNLMRLVLLRQRAGIVTPRAHLQAATSPRISRVPFNIDRQRQRLGEVGIQAVCELHMKHMGLGSDTQLTTIKLPAT